MKLSLPNLQYAYNMTFRNCSTISTPSLTSMNGSLGFYNNYISDFNTAPLLSTIGGSLALVDNAEMTNISLPELQQIDDGLYINNNSQLATLEDFYSLQNIGYDVSLTGDFTR